MKSGLNLIGGFDWFWLRFFRFWHLNWSNLGFFLVLLQEIFSFNVCSILQGVHAALNSLCAIDLGNLVSNLLLNEVLNIFGVLLLTLHLG